MPVPQPHLVSSSVTTGGGSSGVISVASLTGLKEELAKERKARQDLERRVSILEQGTLYLGREF